MIYIYTILFYLALPFVFLRLLWRSRRLPAYRERWQERFGFCPHNLPQSIWVHAVSVGEVIAAIPLIKQLKIMYPDLPLIVTTTTPTGADRVRAAFKDTVFHAYIPYDLPFAVKRFLNRIHPRILIVMETELWPNLFAVCRKANIPIVIANARLSEKSAKGYGSKGMAHIRQGLFQAISMLAAQSEADAARFENLGLPREKIAVTGNLKFDLDIPADLQTKTVELKEQLGDRDIWIAASTHAGEEEIILQAAEMIYQKNPKALLMLVPRHPDRFDTVHSLIKSKGCQVVKRSDKQNCVVETQVYLGDTMGELLLLYSAAEIAFVGGSLVQVGGHNLLEPAFLKKTILTGPILYNFTEISELMLKANGLVIVKNAEEIAEKVLYYFSNHEARQQTSERAYQVFNDNRGALNRQCDVIRKTMSF